MATSPAASTRAVSTRAASTRAASTRAASTSAGKPRQLASAVRFGFFVPLALLAGYEVAELLIADGTTTRTVAWSFSSPLSAAMMGAAYAGAFAMLVVAACRRPWVEARLAWVSAMILLGAMLVISFVSAGWTHLDGDGPNSAVLAAWAFVGVQAIAVVVGIGVLRRQDRAPVGAPAAAETRSWVRLAPVAVIAIAGTGFGIAMIVVPHRIATSWPWHISTMDVRGFGAWTLTYGLASAYALWEADVARLRAGSAAYLVLGVAGLAAITRYSGEMDFDSFSGVVCMVVLAVLTVLGLAGLSLRLPRRRGRRK